MKKVVTMFRHYPFFFKPIQDGTTNPRMELAFREPSKRITKNNKTSYVGDALNTVLNWKNTTNNAYDGEKLHMLYMDEARRGKLSTSVRLGALNVLVLSLVVALSARHLSVAPSIRWIRVARNTSSFGKTRPVKEERQW